MAPPFNIFLYFLHFISVLLLWLLPSCSCAATSHAPNYNSSSHHHHQCLPSELQALRSFAASFSHATSYNATSLIYDDVDLGESWAGDEYCCSWVGVTCTTHIINSSSSSSVHDNLHVNVQNHTNSSHVQAAAARVSQLDFYYMQLSNDIRMLQLSGEHDILRPLCNLTFLSSLRILQGILLDQNVVPDQSFYVPLPECLGDLSSLRLLTLSSCYLKGPIPSSFSRLLNLENLDLTDNPAMSGSLLPLSNLPNLTSCSLSSCSLSGPLPPFRTPLLQSLDLSYNYNFNWTQIDNFILHSSLPSLASLDLSGNSISGTLPHWLCTELSALTTLDLSYNHLVGSAEVITPECQGAGLINLTWLDLSHNQLTGPFPKQFDRSPSLAFLLLSSNNLSGPLPEEWQNLQNLSYLDLSGNSLTYSTAPAGQLLPEWLFRFPKLGALGLSSMKLTSEDLHCGTKLSLLNQTLNFLDLSYNLLTGLDLFSCFALHNFTSLDTLYLAGNPLSVLLTDIHLPPTTWRVDLSSCSLKGPINNIFLEALNSSLIQSITLADNRLVGQVPMCILNSFPQLSSLDLSHNGFDAFQQAQADCMQNAIGFGIISVSNNALVGDLSSVLQSLIGLNWEDIDLSHNELTGEIPSYVGQWEFLYRLKVDHNHLVGRIPHELGDLKGLVTLTLNNNHLEGTIPSSLFTSMTSLTLLDLSHNKLQGNLNALSSPFSDLKSLRVLLLSYNNLTGTLPSFSFGSLLPALQVIDLSHNHLTGTIPQDLHLPSFQDKEQDKDSTGPSDRLTLYEEVPLVIKGLEETYTYILKVFTSLDLSSNHLIGSIPPQLGNLSSLQYLNLAHNNLSGSIPATVGSLSMLQSLDLSFNKLEGSIPLDLLNLAKLGVFNVSFNEALTGKIPTGPQLDDNESYIGDQFLCGPPTLQACKLTHDHAEYAPKMQEKSRNVLAQWMDEWISFAGLSLGIVVGFVGTLWLLHASQLLLTIPKFGARY